MLVIRGAAATVTIAGTADPDRKQTVVEEPAAAISEPAH